jgi:kynurenine formamidase
MREDVGVQRTGMASPVNRREFVLAAGASAALALANPARPAAAQEATDPVADFIGMVKGARLYDLSFVWDENAPLAGVNPPFSMELNATHAGSRGQFDAAGQLSYTSDVMRWSGQHGAPTIDAIGHIGHNGWLFGGVDAAAATSDPRGIGRSGVGTNLGIDGYPRDLLVNRGVLLDVARFVRADSLPLDPGFEITWRHLEDTAASQKTQLEPGDTVLIRTGWGRYFFENRDLYKGEQSPGPGVEGAEFLVAKGARVVGNDTLTFEKRPATTNDPTFQVFPVHMLLLADNGIYIVENLWLDEIAEQQTYQFLVVVPPLKILGGTGSALRAFALAP